MWRVLGFLISITVFIAGTADGKCGVADVQACALKSTKLDPSTLLMNKNDIVATCNIFAEVKDCFSSLTGCSAEVEKLVDAAKLVSAMFTSICSDDKSIQAFQESSRCMQDNSKYFGECTKRDSTSNSLDAFSSENCKQQETMGKCYIKRVGEKCTEKAKKVAVNIFKEVENILNSRCHSKVSIVNSGSAIFLHMWMMLCAFVFAFVINFISLV